MLKITYIPTLEELVQSQCLLAEITGTKKVYFWRCLFVMILLIILGDVGIFFSELISFDFLYVAIIASIQIGMVSALWYFQHHRALHKQYMHHYKRLEISEKGVSREVTVEMNDQELSYTTVNYTIHSKWDYLSELNENKGNIEVIFRKPTSVIILPRRIFNSDAQYHQWLDFIKSKLK